MIKRGVAVGDTTCDFKVVKLCDSDLKGTEPSLQNPFRKNIFHRHGGQLPHQKPKPRDSRTPRHRVFSGRRGGAWPFNHRLLRPDVHGGAYSASSLLSSPDPNHWFSVLDAHSSRTKIIFLQCSMACFTFVDKIYPLATVQSAKWEHSDSFAARKYRPSILESLVGS